MTNAIQSLRGHVLLASSTYSAVRIAGKVGFPSDVERILTWLTAVVNGRCIWLKMVGDY